MVILVIGGSGSGKSEYAESCCVRLHSKKKIYIATMQPCDEESYDRIRKHRNMRDGRGFETMECYTHLEEVEVPAGCTVLLECMSNLVANEMFSDAGRKENAPALILQGLSRLERQAGDLIIVTNQVFCDGIVYDEGTDAYLRALAKVNRCAAKMADVVCEVIHGIPVFEKGKECMEAHVFGHTGAEAPQSAGRK